MITAQQALALADAAGVADGWGRITEPRYEAVTVKWGGRPVWEVRRREVVIGQGLVFMIDQENGAILDKRKSGPR